MKWEFILIYLIKVDQKMISLNEHLWILLLVNTIFYNNSTQKNRKFQHNTYLI